MNVKLLFEKLQRARRAITQTDIHKLSIYVQNRIEWYIVHGYYSKKYGQHEKQFISHRYIVRHNYVELRMGDYSICSYNERQNNVNCY